MPAYALWASGPFLSTPRRSRTSPFQALQLSPSLENEHRVRLGCPTCKAAKLHHPAHGYSDHQARPLSPPKLPGIRTPALLLDFFVFHQFLSKIICKLVKLRLLLFPVKITKGLVMRGNVSGHCYNGIQGRKEKKHTPARTRALHANETRTCYRDTQKKRPPCGVSRGVLLAAEISWGYFPTGSEKNPNISKPRVICHFFPYGSPTAY